MSGLLGNTLPGHGCIYVEQTMRFTNPVFIGDTITARTEVLSYNQEKGVIRLKTECYNQENKLVLEGEAVMLVPKEVG